MPDAGEARRRARRGRTAKMLVLVPGHNEEHSIVDMPNALLAQTRVPDRIMVVAGNCTDKTEQIARRLRSVRVMRTVGNTDRKVGALNQGWRRWQAGCDYVASLAKSFFLYDGACFTDRAGVFTADLAISLDVIYHLTEGAVFETYLTHLFAAAAKCVIMPDWAGASLTWASPPPEPVPARGPPVPLLTVRDEA